MAITWLSSPSIGIAEPAAVAYSEKVSYTTGSGAKPTASVQLRCPWTDADAICEDIILNYHRWPYPALVDMYIQSASWKAAPQTKTGRDGSGNEYPTALIDLAYGWQDLQGGEPGEVDPITESISPNAQMIKLKALDKKGGSMFSLGDSPQPEDWFTDSEGGPDKLIVGLDYNIKWDLYSGPFPPELLTLMNHVNDDNVVSYTFGLTFAAQTLLLTATNIERIWKPTGVSKSLSLNFSWRQHTWNKYWRARTATWESIYFWPDSEGEETTEPIEYINYPLADFGPITVPPTPPPGP